MNKLELLKEVESQEIEYRALSEKLNNLYLAIKDKKNLLESIEKKEEQQMKIEKENEYLKKTFGVEGADSETYIVFTKKAEFVKILKRGIDFKYNDDLEQILRKEKLYAHCLSSFTGRSSEWYELGLAQQLKNLGWEFGKSGSLIKTSW